MEDTTTDVDIEVSQDVEEVEVRAARKLQLERYEPFTGDVTLEASVPDFEGREHGFDDWLNALENKAVERAEQVTMDRYEAYVRQEAFEDDDE